MRYSKLETIILYEGQKINDTVIPIKRNDKIKSKIKPKQSNNKYSTKNLRKIVKQMREKDFYVPQNEQRKIDWSAYNLNQINDIIDTLYFIKTEVDKIHIQKNHNSVGRPPIDEGKLAKAILFIELFRIPERKAEGWIFLIGSHLGINERIDDRVIGKAYKRKGVIDIIFQVYSNTKSSDGKMGGDGTGLETTRKDNYESMKKKGLYMTSIVDSREVVQEFDISGKQECIIMHDLVKRVSKELKKDVNKLLKKATLTLDSGFVDKKLAQLIEDNGIIPFIFPKKNNKLKSDGFPGWKKMLKSLIKDVQAWLNEYHIRSHTESFHSSFKRIFGIVTKRLDDTRLTQILAAIIHNNRRKINYFNMASI